MTVDTATSGSGGSNQPTSCLHCGAQCVVIVGRPSDAPWRCPVCAHGWWTTELTSGPGVYRPLVGDFGYGSATDALVSARDAEMQAASEQGTSLPTQGIPTMTDSALLLAVQVVKATALLGDLNAEIQTRGI